MMNLLFDYFDSYNPKNEQESRDLDLIKQFIKRNQDCLDRTNLAAHVTVSTFVVNQKMDKIVFGYHKIYQSWSWIGGHADGNPNLLEVAIKETHEETGLKNIKPWSQDLFTIDVIQVTNHIKHQKYIPDHLHLNVSFLMIADELETLRFQPEEHLGVKWFKLDEVLKFVTEKRMIPVYEKAFSHIYKIKEHSFNVS